MNLKSLSSLVIGFEPRAFWQSIVFMLILYVCLILCNVMISKQSLFYTSLTFAPSTGPTKKNVINSCFMCEHLDTWVGNDPSGDSQP